MDVKIKTALISVSDKTGIVDFAKGLSSLGIRIISTGGTARQLIESNVPVVEVEAVTGVPEILDGRVKTLHPKIHAGILAVRDYPDHMNALKAMQAEPIDLVCVNLYPFEQTILRPGSTMAQAIENIDIGGPTLIRAAAKNHRFVAVVTSPDQYGKVLDTIRSTGGVPEQMRSELARAAFALTAGYDAAIARYLDLKAGVDFPERLCISLQRQMLLRYGENPHQPGAFYTIPLARETSISKANLICGEVEISFNNLLDANAAFELVKEFDEPAAAVVKHLNPCGCAIDEDIKIAYRKAYEGDVVSAFGGIIALNRPVDVELARWIMESYGRFGKALGATGFFAEVIVAPSFEQDAIELIRTLKSWGSRVRLVQTGPIDRASIDHAEYDARHITGGMLLQRRDLIGWEPELLTYPTRQRPTQSQMEDLRVAWLVAKHAKSNAIVLAKNKKVIGVGTGQMNRLKSIQIAITHADQDAKGAVMASDAFLPFADNVEMAAAAGIQAIIQPGGSKKDDEVIAAADKHGIAIVFTDRRHFRH